MYLFIALIPVFQLIHCTDGLSVLWLHNGTPDTSDGMCSPIMPPCTRLPQLAPVGKYAKGKSASPISCFCCAAWVSAWLSDRFYKIHAVPAWKHIGLTALSRGNSQKKIHFRRIQTPFTTSRKQFFIVYKLLHWIPPLWVEKGESVFTVCFTLKSTGKKCW